MALDEAAAQAAAEAATAEDIAATPPMLVNGVMVTDWVAYYAANAPERYAAMVEGNKKLFLRVFNAIKANAVVQPAASSPFITATGIPVLGNGKIV